VRSKENPDNVSKEGGGDDKTHPLENVSGFDPVAAQEAYMERLKKDVEETDEELDRHHERVSNAFDGVAKRYVGGDIVEAFNKTFELNKQGNLSLFEKSEPENNIDSTAKNEALEERAIKNIKDALVDVGNILLGMPTLGRDRVRKSLLDEMYVSSDADIAEIRGKEVYSVAVDLLDKGRDSNEIMETLRNIFESGKSPEEISEAVRSMQLDSNSDSLSGDTGLSQGGAKNGGKERGGFLRRLFGKK